MRIAISGGTGLIGRRLTGSLRAGGHDVVVVSRGGGAGSLAWNPVSGPPPEEALQVDAFVHLAGEPVAQRWTAAARRKIRDSRVLGTHHLVQGMERYLRRPHVLVSASATGYYGTDRGEEVLTEASSAGSGFLPEICVEWEREADRAQALGVRVVKLRTGIVLAEGGALERMLPAFRLGAGAKLGSGRQWMSWIALADIVGMIEFALRQPVSGAFNGVAPQPVRNAEFTRELAHALHRPAFFTAPGIVLRALFGEMSGLLLGSQRVVPGRALAAGFTFRYPELPAALAAALRRRPD